MHFQRFGEVVRLCKEKMDQKNVYLYNPAFESKPIMPPTPEVTPPTPEVTPPTDTEGNNSDTAPELDVELEVRVEVPSNTIRTRYNGYNPPIYG